MKLLRGTSRPDRLNPGEPQPKPGTPSARRGLPAEVRTWHRGIVRALAGLRVLTRSDAMIVELTAAALAEYARHSAALARDGHVYTTTTPTGSAMHRARPEVRLASDAWRRAFNGLGQLGLTPASRSKVSAIAGAGAPADVYRPRKRWTGLLK